MQQYDNTPYQPYNNPSAPTPAPAPVTPTPPEPSRGEGWRSALSTILILIAAPVVALLLTAFVFQSYEVDGPSMESTLQNHDRLIVLKVRRTVARLTHHNYIPNRGDVIVFTKHNLQEFGDAQSDKQLIKRVVGLPGDRVVVKDGVLTIYNAQNPNGFIPDQTMPYGSVIQVTPGNVDTTVKDGEVFVAGDNRTNSLDSRYFGAIPAKDIVGKLLFRVFPIDQAKMF
jgi:signal peptidase I